MSFLIRDETPDDFLAIDHVNDLAFGETAQSQIIRELRANNQVLWSRVLILEGTLIGHLLFYPVLIDRDYIAAGLGPISIHPSHQKKGFGGELIRDGLAQCRTGDYGVVFLLGHTSYYPRFGFSSDVGSDYISPWPRPAFMGLRLRSDVPQSGALTFPKAYL